MTFGYDATYETSSSRNLMGIHDHAIGLLGRIRNERPFHPVKPFPHEFYFQRTYVDSGI